MVSKVTAQGTCSSGLFDSAEMIVDECFSWLVGWLVRWLVGWNRLIGFDHISICH